MSRVLFLCSGNYYRSRFAEACFNYHAARRGLAWTAQSRGFRLSPQNVGPISEHTTQALVARGIPPEAPPRMPRVVSQDDLASATIVVALKHAEHWPLMQARFPDWAERIEYWHIHDMDFAQPVAALGELETGIHRLLDRLAAGSCTAPKANG